MKLKVRDKTYHMVIHQHRDNLPLLIMLHGFMGSGDVFTHLLVDLEKFVNPVTLDLLGHGSSEGDQRTGRYSLDEQIEDLSVILHNFHPDQVFLHGYSMGGRLALHLALTYPDAINGLILESTTFGITDESDRNERKILDEQRAKAIETDFYQFLDSWDRLPLFKNDIDVPADLKNRYKSIQHNQTPSSMANSLRGFGTGFLPSAERDLEKLNIPVLILAGELDDKYCSLSEIMQQKLPDSRARIIKNAGHRVHLENPGAFVSEIESFLGHYRAR